MSQSPHPPKDIGSAVPEGLADESKEFSRSKEMSNLPPLNDHAFWRNLRVQCNCDKPMSRIAAELGVDVDELCAWIMAYKAPKNKPYVNRESIPTFAVSKQGDGADTDDARRFAAWRKQKAGAAATRKMLETTQQ